MAATNFDDPEIPVDCADAVLPTGLTREECYTPELNFGGIVEVYFASEPFADPTVPANLVPTGVELAAAITANKVVGPVPLGLSYAPPTDATVRAYGKDIPIPTDLVLTALGQDTKQEWTDFARSTQKGGYSAYVYGVDANGNWFGGRNGMLGGRATVVLRNNLPTGETDLQTITGTIKRRGYFDSIRGVSPVPTLQTT
jgi:hypothetical protein